MDYTLVKRLAVGGMAELFLARAHADGRYAGTVVIKTLRADETDPERAAGILRNEGRLGAALRHPSIVRLLEAETEVERPHLVLEFIFGRDLGQLFDRCRARHQPIPAEHVRTIVADVLEALDYTYYGARLEGAPVRAVHLDVSPQNVMVGFDGRTRLVDFGLAEGAHREEMRDRGGLAGKVPYMAPEQLRGAEVDHRTDLFGAGVLSWGAADPAASVRSRRRRRERRCGPRGGRAVASVPRATRAVGPGVVDLAGAASRSAASTPSRGALGGATSARARPRGGAPGSAVVDGRAVSRASRPPSASRLVDRRRRAAPGGAGRGVRAASE
jgi:hypothetical protein